MADIHVRKEIEKIAKTYANLVKKEIKTNSVYLFGSFVKGDYKDCSDIDIAVIANDFTGDIIEDTMKLMRIRRKVDNRIEPHPFRSNDFTLENPFVKEILETGIKIA